MTLLRPFQALLGLAISAVLISWSFAQSEDHCEKTMPQFTYYLSLNRLKQSHEAIYDSLVKNACLGKMTALNYIVWTQEGEIVWPPCSKTLSADWIDELNKLKGLDPTVVMTNWDLALIYLVLVRDKETEYPITNLLKNVPFLESGKKIFFYTFALAGIDRLWYIDFNNPQANHSGSGTVSVKNARNLDEKIRTILENRKSYELDIKLQGFYQGVDLAEKIQNNDITVICGDKNNSELDGRRSNTFIKLSGLNVWEVISDLYSEEFYLSHEINLPSKSLFKTNLLLDVLQKSTIERDGYFVLNYFKTNDFDWGKYIIKPEIEAELDSIRHLIQKYFLPLLASSKHDSLYIEIVGFADNRFRSGRVSELTDTQTRENRKIAEDRAQEVKKWLAARFGPRCSISIGKTREKYFLREDRSVEIKAWLRNKELKP